MIFVKGIEPLNQAPQLRRLTTMIKEKCDRCGSPLGTKARKPRKDFVVIVKENFNYRDIRDSL